MVDVVKRAVGEQRVLSINFAETALAPATASASRGRRSFRRARRKPASATPRYSSLVPLAK